MLEKILKISLPKKNCVTELLPVVAKPSIGNVNIWQSSDETNWPNVSVREFITVGGNHYGFIYYPLSVSNPVITPFDPATKTFGEAYSIPITTYNTAIVIGTDKIYFYGGRLLNDSTLTNRLFEYDPTTKTLTEKGTGGGAVRENGCGCQIGDRLFFFSGKSGTTYVSAFTEYNLTSNTFINQPTTPVARQNGSIINFGGIGYLTGCVNANDYATMRKVWSFNPSTNTWTDTGHVTNTYINYESKWTILNNELYLMHTSDSNSDMGLILDKYVPGTGFVNVVGPSATPAQNLNGFLIDKPLSIHDINGTYWVRAKLSYGGPNGYPQDDLIGRLDIANNTLIGDLYPIGIVQMTIYCSTIVTDIPDTPEKVSFRFYGTDEGIPVDLSYLELTTNYSENLVVEGSNAYTLNQPLAIKADSITGFKIAYKSVKSEWGPWSDLYPRNGGG